MRLACLLLAGTLVGGLVLGTAGGCGSATGNLPTPQPPKVKVSAPLLREIRDVDEYTGRIEATQTVEVRARVSGYLENVLFKDGDYVEKGQPLFQIDPRTYQAEYDQAQARIKLYDAKYVYAKSVRVRNDSLLKAKAISQEEFDQSVAAENESLAARTSAEADTETNRLNLEFTKITAEISGRIDRTFITRGNMVTSGPGATVLTRIVSIDPVFVYFNPDELAFLRYTERRVASDGRFEATHVRDRKIECSITLADGTVYPEKGLVDFASNVVDPSTGTITVRATFPNPKRSLTSGLFVRLHIAGEQAYTALLVPERAINTDQSDKFVYVVDADDKAQRQNVTLGTRQGRLRVIKKGLAAGDRVIISGGLLVRPGEQVDATPGEIDASQLPTTGRAPSAGDVPPAPAAKSDQPPASKPRDDQ